jgi:hypothetical protein
MLRIIYLLILTILSYTCWAQGAASTANKADTTTRPAAPPPAVIIAGSADLYYRYNFSRQVNNLTSFTNSHDQFTLGMASVKLEHKTSKVDMVADLGFGARAKEFDYADEGAGTSVLQTIKQLYISYTPAAWIKFTGGTWATHVGYEVMDAFGNRNYSMSYLFTNGPFSHTGVRADLTLGKSGLMIGVSNPTDYRSIPAGGQNNKNLIAQYSYAASDNFKLFLNYVGGRDIDDNKVHQYDLVINAKASSIFGLGFNATVNKSSYTDDNYATGHTWWGSALYLNLNPLPWFGLTLRSEYFSDKDGIKLHPIGDAAGAIVFANTLSADFKVDGFTFIPEFRLDNGSETLFSKHEGTATKSTGSFLLAAIYSF